MIQIHVIKSKLAEEQQHKHKKSIHKVRVASLPQLERKVIVLFGIEQYADRTIPSLEKAVTGVEAIGKCYSGTFTQEQKHDRSSLDIKSDDILVEHAVVAMSSEGDAPIFLNKCSAISGRVFHKLSSMERLPLQGGEMR